MLDMIMFIIATDEGKCRNAPLVYFFQEMILNSHYRYGYFTDLTIVCDKVK